MQALTQKRALRGMGLFAAVALLSLLISACGSSNSSTSTSAANTSSGAATSTPSANSKVKTIAIATPAKTNDYGWNAQGVAGAKAAASSVGANVDVSSNIGYDKTPTVLRQIALNKPQLIIAHASGFDTAAQRIGQQYKIPTVTYDIPTMKSPGAVSNITTESQQAAYLAGILAAHKTKTGKVGIIISASDSNWFKMAGGFAAGVHSVNPKTKIAFAEISSAGYDDSAGGKRVATSMIADGADVIFAMGDGASFGYLQAIETANPGHKVWFIGDIGDMTPIDKNGVFLSSVLWNFTDAYKQFIKEIDNGTFGQQGYDLTLANGGVSLLKTKYIPASVWSDIQDAQKKIISGQIQVPNDSKMSQVKAALNG
jgi:simple sugar transport system substrate-binding protein